MNDVWWTRCGRMGGGAGGGGGGPRSNNILEVIIERSNDSQDS